MLNHTRLTINGKVRLKNYTKLQLQVSHWMGVGKRLQRGEFAAHFFYHLAQLLFLLLL